MDDVEGVRVGYDDGGLIVDVAVPARNAPALLDFGRHDGGAFPARVTYDATADAIAVDLDTSPYADSDEVAPGLIVDRDVDGLVRGLEILNASRLLSAEAMSGVRKRAILL
ncbi:DUF2283 domain-containing protein [Roseiarcus fermentans]|uniref:DUF2283 domain-containing protein n=1 Tax=Roseiarcus fermentans TaxID=1473586 RepID=UPI001AEC89D1|nr:DUF2283 domain-containing protein [Roseiarcus fermentans]